MKYERGSFITVPSRDVLRGMEPMAQTLYMWLCSYANETGNCFPSRKTLSEDVGCSENSIDRMVVLLIENGLITKRKQMKDGVYTSNLYTVLVQGGPPQHPPSPLTAPRVAPDVRSNSIQLTKTNEDRGIEDSPRPQIVEVYESSDLDGELGDSKSPRLSPDKRKAYDELIAWSENERGFEFPKTTRLKQYRAFKLANTNGISREHLIERWEDMSSDKFWQNVGFDWMNVVQELLKKPI